jgi:hypothetical protein
LRHAGGDRVMAQVLAVVPQAGLDAVLVAAFEGAGLGRLVHKGGFWLAGHCGALAEQCPAQVSVVSGGGWWTSERRCDGARRLGLWPTGDD